MIPAPLRSLDFRSLPDDAERLLVIDPLELQPQPLAVPLSFLLVAQRFDGVKTTEAIASDLHAEGIEVQPEAVRFIADQLAAAQLLADAPLQERLRGLEREALSGPRPARLAGTCYPLEASAAGAWIDGLLAQGRPPLATPGYLQGIVLPHIDPRLGGATYGHGYRTLATLPPSDVYVVLGIGHAGLQHGISLAPVDFQTPFGAAKADPDICPELVSRLGDWILADQMVQRREHSIEFQAVFLKHVIKQPFTLVPLLTSFGSADLARMRTVLATMRRVLAESGKRVTVLSSVDFSHVGPMYGDSTPAAPLMTQVQDRDRQAISLLEKADAEGFWQAIHADRNATRICGTSSMWSMLELVEPRAGHLLAYDEGVMDDRDSRVTFAAMAF